MAHNVNQPLYVCDEGICIQLFGELHVIADPATVVGICGDNPGQLTVAEAPYSFGWQILGGSCMWMDGKGQVFLVTNNQKYPIVNNEALAYYQLNGGQQRGTGPSQLPTGPAIGAPS